mmetsp:Transcript_38121/g.79910  ORF Transcript_38121/g.79910 Transcript_38121/m.79910 type:complete len:287 (+) Transcript_38121:59-919(+)
MTMPAETKTTRTISRQHERMSSTATMDESSTIRTPPPATTSGRGNGMMKRRRHHQRLPTLVADDHPSPSSPKESAATSMKISLNNDTSASSGSGVISGQAFYITNNNSMDGIPTIYMWLYSCNPTKWLTYSITSSNGMYRFHNLPPGYYYAVAQPPEGYALSNVGNIYDTLDSAFDAESGKTICYYLKEGEKVMHWNFGLYETAFNGANETTSLHRPSVHALIILPLLAIAAAWLIMGEKRKERRSEEEGSLATTVVSEESLSLVYISSSFDSVLGLEPNASAIDM